MKTRFSFVKDLSSMAMVLGLNPRNVAYALKNKEALSRKITIPKPGGKNRTTYESLRELHEVQAAITKLLNTAYSMFEADCIIAYRSGINAREVVATELSEWCEYLVHVDIKAYYDFIPYHKIRDTLTFLGMPLSGAEVLAKLCCVKRYANGHPIYTCQQGSPCGPVVANLVGHVYLDRHLVPWVENRCWELGLRHKLYRYSDNIVLGVTGQNSAEFIVEYKAKVREILTAGKFKGKDWATVSKTHPKKNQQFLGVVLNHAPKVEGRKYKNTEAAMLNLARTGMDRPQLLKWCAKERPALERSVDSAWWEDSAREAALMWAQGVASAVKCINLKQHTCLKKLHAAMKFTQQAYTGKGEIPEQVMAAVLRFSNAEESVADYAARIQEVSSTFMAEEAI